jgi:hypothetical protein
MGSQGAKSKAQPAAGAEGIYARALSRPLALSEGKTRAPAYDRERLGEGVPVTIPGNLAQDEARAKIEVEPRRSPSPLAIPHFFFPKTINPQFR